MSFYRNSYAKQFKCSYSINIISVNTQMRDILDRNFLTKTVTQTMLGGQTIYRPVAIFLWCIITVYVPKIMKIG